MRFCPAIGLLMLLLAGSCGLRADDASKNAKVEEYFELAQLKQNMGQMMQLVRNQMNARMLEQLSGSKMPAELREDFDRFQGDIYRILEEALGWESMRPEYTRIFAEAFTGEELDAILAFYRSPAGRTMVSKTPQLMQQSSEVSQRRLASVAPRLQELSRQWKATVEERMSQQADTGDASPKP